jgi:hypothetical protein
MYQKHRLLQEILFQKKTSIQEKISNKNWRAIPSAQRQGYCICGFRSRIKFCL